jgi:hypothetical protein
MLPSTVWRYFDSDIGTSDEPELNLLFVDIFKIDGQ